MSDQENKNNKNFRLADDLVAQASGGVGVAPINEQQSPKNEPSSEQSDERSILYKKKKPIFW